MSVPLAHAVDASFAVHIT